jgi:hypothetical protein
MDWRVTRKGRRDSKVMGTQLALDLGSAIDANCASSQTEFGPVSRGMPFEFVFVDSVDLDQ